MTRILVLASTSPYRKDLLTRLRVPFSSAAPGIDESVRKHEDAASLTERLSREKASVVARQFRDALVIGADQVAVLQSEILGKPGSHLAASRQLRKMSGREVIFLTAVTVLDSRTGTHSSRTIQTRVTFRHLSDSTIEEYLAKERPYDCAGSAKAEGLGIALISRIQCDDPTALIGLPLITVTELLTEHGFRII